MKKLNNGGFTLIELLAVIIILAIVVGITVPSVLNSVNGAKKSAFETSLDTMADWIERQYQIAQVGDEDVGTSNKAFSKKCANLSNCTDSNNPVNANDADLLKAAGVKFGNYESITFYINSDTGRACVKATSKSNGDFGTQKSDTESSGC